ncbi:MAG: CopG family ribbon-helix-helix protein [Alphaproteobacteria bacterium]|jgi:predicted transcriptional regulator|nr:CopG family ribbon-helix-helix protein [Alphaproteobacteria bacterium]
MPKPATRPVTVRLNSGDVDKLDALAEATERSRAWHVEKALEAYLDLQAWQLEHIAKGLDQLESGEGISHEEIVADLEGWGKKSGRESAA